MKMLFHSLDLKFGPDDPRRKDAEIMGEKMDHLNKIVEQILARQACPPDEVDAETTRLLRLTKSDLISRCLATPDP